GGAGGEVDEHPSRRPPPVVDAGGDAGAVAEVGHLHERPERERRVRDRHALWVVRLAAGGGRAGSAIAVAGRVSAFVDGEVLCGGRVDEEGEAGEQEPAHRDAWMEVVRGEAGG